MLARRNFLKSAAATGLFAVAGRSAFAADYPVRPIEIIVPWGPGGGADSAGRKIGKILEGKLKVSMPVVNVPGATGVSGLTKLLAAPADGYSVMVMTADTTGVYAMTKQNRWSMDEITPIGMLTIQRSGFHAKEGGQYKAWSDVTEAAKTKELKVAITGLASPEEVAVNELKKRGYKFTAVPYAKPGERYAALLGDHVDLLYEQAGDIKGFIEGKQIKPIMFLAPGPVSGFESVTTSKSLGIDLVLDQYRTFNVKTGTPAPVVKLLTENFAEAVATPEYKQYLDEQWADPKSGLGAKETAEFIKRDIAALQKLAS